jgi:hypothetical protein
MKIEILRRKIKELTDGQFHTWTIENEETGEKKDFSKRGSSHETSKYFEELTYWLRRKEAKLEMQQASKVQGKEAS